MLDLEQRPCSRKMLVISASRDPEASLGLMLADDPPGLQTFLEQCLDILYNDDDNSIRVTAWLAEAYTGDVDANNVPGVPPCTVYGRFCDSFCGWCLFRCIVGQTEQRWVPNFLDNSSTWDWKLLNRLAGAMVADDIKRLGWRDTVTALLEVGLYHELTLNF